MKMENQYRMAQAAPRGAGCDHGTTTLFPAHVTWNIDSVITQNHPFHQAAALGIHICQHRDHWERDRGVCCHHGSASAQPSFLCPVHPPEQPPRCQQKNPSHTQKPPCHVQDFITLVAPLRHHCSPSPQLQAVGSGGPVLQTLARELPRANPSRCCLLTLPHTN